MILQKAFLFMMIIGLFLSARNGFTVEIEHQAQEVLAQQDMPVRMAARFIPSYYDTAIEELGVYSLQQEALESVPFQFTQLTNENTVYSPAFKKIKSDGHINVLDAHDRLEFMYADAGEHQCLDALVEQWSKDQAVGLSSGHFIKPVQIQVLPNRADGKQAQSRYICIAQASLLPDVFIKESNYVVYNAELGHASSRAYFLTVDQENPLIWHDFHYQGVNLEEDTGFPIGESILDSLKINMRAGVFSNVTQVHFDNTNLLTEVLDVQHGPIYDSMFGLTKVTLAGATVFKLQVMVHFYPHHVEMMTRFKIPAIAKAILRSPQVDVSFDANNLWGSKIKTSWGPEVPMQVNGLLDEQEKAFIQQEVASENSWIWYSTQRGFDLFTFIDFDKDFQVPIALVYDDHKTQEIPPERFIGQGPNVGYSIRGMVMGKYFTFNTHLMFSKQVKLKDVESKVLALKQPWGFMTTASSDVKVFQASLR